jgi:integrase
MAKYDTVLAIESQKPKAQEYKFTVDRGLYIRVAPDGVKTWLVRYVIDGKQKQYTLPKPYGKDGGGFMSLIEAKAENANIQSMARDGVDYLAQKAEQKTEKELKEEFERAQKRTFKDLYDTWLKDGVSRSDDNKSLKMLFNKHALPSLSQILLKELSESDLRDTYRTIISQGKQRTAVALSNDIGQMLRWGEKRKPWRSLLIDGNPSDLVEIDKLLTKDYSEERTRTLSIDELRKLNTIFNQLDQDYKNAPKKYETERPLKKETEIALWLCLSTTCRIGELLMTEWAHVDFEARTWFIPKENVKGTRGKKQEQLVYLSDFALAQFKALHELTKASKWAFPAKNMEGHVCVKTVSKQVGDRQTQFKQRSRELKNRVNNNTLVLGTEEWTPHDLRRTASTMMQELKIPLDVIDRCQNHILAGSKVRRHYMQYEYADEKREAWEKLGNRIEAILSADNVVSIGSRAA